MEVGDYVRTDNGLIGKIISFKGDMVETDNKRLITYKSYHSGCKIEKRPIDLIEVGDYVNGKRVEWIGYDLYRENEDKTLTGIGEKRILFNEFTKDSVREKGIMTIVTKEQMESIEYKVGE